MERNSNTLNIIRKIKVKLALELNVIKKIRVKPRFILLPKYYHGGCALGFHAP
jgi:hypothetical protein